MVYPKVEIPDRWEADFDITAKYVQESKTVVRKE